MNDDGKYVSRGGDKLASVAGKLGLDFAGKVVLDVGASTGGFTDYALQNGAARVIAVDAGTNQLHANLRQDPRVEVHEKTDVREFRRPIEAIDLILIDVNFVSLKDILPVIAKIALNQTAIAALLKPQFEAKLSELNRGIIKNDTIRRRILKEFEAWCKDRFAIIAKADSGIAGTKGNLERFYLLQLKKGKRAARESDSFRSRRDEEKP